MTYEEFKQELLERLEENRPACVEKYAFSSVTKNNMDKNDAIQIHYNDDRAMCPIVYTEEYYNDHLNGRTMDEITRAIHRIARDHYVRDLEMDVPEISPEYSREHLTLRLINKEWNPDVAEKCAHLEINDLIAVPRWDIEMGDASGSLLITRDIQRDMLKMTDEEILTIAKKNAMEQGFTVKGMSEVLREMAGEEFLDLVEEMEKPEKENMYVMTSKKTSFGAVGLLSTELLKEAREKFGENYFVIPSSVHECLFVPESTCDNPKVLQDMCKEVNENMVDVRERLGENIYRFNGENLRICNSREEMVEQVTDTLKQQHSHTQKRRIGQ